MKSCEESNGPNGSRYKSGTMRRPGLDDINDGRTDV
jgi:hypothetical protein